MRKIGAGLFALVVLLLAIVAIGELNETDEEADEPARTTTEALPSPSPGTETGAAPEPEPEPDSNGGSGEAAVERAVFAYLERAERGEVGPPGLPTTDEASVERIFVAGTRARVRLTGGASLVLVRRGRRWTVVRAVPAQVEPQPPSGPP